MVAIPKPMPHTNYVYAADKHSPMCVKARIHNVLLFEPYFVVQLSFYFEKDNFYC